tara:strand:+ start:9563 stop:11881 length:2319 start_codon:yes stop_codon:yes gene_type:complete
MAKLNYKDFKKRLDKNESSGTEEETRQAFVFKRLDIFISGGVSQFPRAKRSQRVQDYQNYNPETSSPHLSIYDLLTEIDSEDVTTRRKMYSRSGFPVSSKSNWSGLSNNFRIYRNFDDVTGDNIKNNIVEFPKSIKDNNLNTIIAFTGFDIDFEGTYIDTARSDVSVKARFTLDNFSLLKNYYNNDGEKHAEVEVDKTKYVRFLDLFTPPDLEEGVGFVNKGITLEVYTNLPDKTDVYRNSENATGSSSISFRNHLKMNLYIVDHTMTFNETTNKVDVEIEYRAAADLTIRFDNSQENNILYTKEKRKEIQGLIEKRETAFDGGCYEDSEVISDKISDIEKRSVSSFIKELENTESPGTVYNAATTKAYRAKNYEHTTFNDVPRSAGVSRLKSYGEKNFEPKDEDYNISKKLTEAGFPGIEDHYTSLKSLLMACLPYREGTDGWMRTNNCLFLPFIPHAWGDDQPGFYLGDLPINLSVFNDWYNTTYVQEDIYYLDYKTFVKDVIENYVSPHLVKAWYNIKKEMTLKVSIKDVKGELKIASNEGRILYENRKKNTFTPHAESTGDNKDLVLIFPFLDNGGDFLASRTDAPSNLGEKLEKITDNYILIEGKSPYGPFKDLKLSKNDSGYLREIRSVAQGITDIAQLGAVYDTTMGTHPNCPDFRFFPGEMCYLYIPEFGLSSDKKNLAYKLGIGGHQIITKVSHKIDLEGTAKMTTELTMRYWSSGVVNDHMIDPTSQAKCESEKTKAKPTIDTGQFVDPSIVIRPSGGGERY